MTVKKKIPTRNCPLKGAAYVLKCYKNGQCYHNDKTMGNKMNWNFTPQEKFITIWRPMIFPKWKLPQVAPQDHFSECHDILTVKTFPPYFCPTTHGSPIVCQAYNSAPS